MQSAARLTAGQGEVEDGGEKGFSWASPREMCNSPPPHPTRCPLSCLEVPQADKPLDGSNFATCGFSFCLCGVPLSCKSFFLPLPFMPTPAPTLELLVGQG